MNNQHDDDRLAVGWHARDYMENNEVNPEVTQKYFSHVRSFYCQLVSTLLNKFPFHDKILQSLGFLNPETRDTVSANEVGALSERFLQHDKKQMSVVMDKYEEFLLYPATDFIQTDLSTTDTNTDDQLQSEPLQTFWKKVEDKKIVSSGKPMFPNLTKLARVVLSLPHLNADPERTFLNEERFRQTVETTLSKNHSQLVEHKNKQQHQMFSFQS